MAVKTGAWTEGSVLSASLREAFIREASKPTIFDAFPEKPDTRSWLRRRWDRLRWWWSAHRPVLHFGPCDHTDCW